MKMSGIVTDQYKKPYIILLSACDEAASALPKIKTPPFS